MLPTILVAVPGHLLILLVAGRRFLDGVYVSQAYRESGWNWTIDILREVGVVDAPLLACGLLGLFLLREKTFWRERLFVLAFVPPILSFDKIFRVYFLMPLYFLAIPGGVLLANACRRAERFKPLAVMGLASATIVVMTVSFRHYLFYNDKWEIPGVTEITRTIRAETNDDDLIFGGLATPVFSFLTDRRILGNALFTDTEVVTSGLLDLDVVRTALANDPRVKVVLMTDHGGYLSLRGGRLNDVLVRYFRGVGIYRGKGETIYLLRRIGVEPTQGG